MSASSPHLRIVSLVPSLTETVCDLGLRERLVGCTSFCVHPKDLRKKVPTVGGTKDADVEKIFALKPTHVLVNTEENLNETIATLRRAQPHLEVIETFPHTPRDSIEMVVEIAALLGCDCREWQEACVKQLERLEGTSYREMSYLYFIWRNPWMVAGNRTYINAMLQLIGLTNVIETTDALKCRYPSLEISDPRIERAQLLFFSTEPYAFKKRHAEEFLAQEKIKTPYLIVDGQMLSWFGTRTLKALRYLEKLAAAIP